MALGRINTRAHDEGKAAAEIDCCATAEGEAVATVTAMLDSHHGCGRAGHYF